MKHSGKQAQIKRVTDSQMNFSGYEVVLSNVKNRCSGSVTLFYKIHNFEEKEHLHTLYGKE